MGHVNVEVKAKTDRPEEIRALLRRENAEYVGRDRQVDTYFRVATGRLKLREGRIENALIYYRRDDARGPKRSDVILYHPEPGSALKTILTEALGIDVVVDKTRDIYFIGNVKFHVDEVTGLGTFVEIEAVDREGTVDAEALRRQCETYVDLLGVQEEELLSRSYSDMLRSEG